MIHDVRGKRSLERLADAVKDAQEGDTIRVETLAARKLGRQALEGLCPDKVIRFEVEPLPYRYKKL